MSVLKTHRSISSVEFLENAIELEKYTHGQCKKFPKSERFFLAIPIFNLSHDIVYHVKAGNDILPRDQHEVQVRRDQFLAHRYPNERTLRAAIRKGVETRCIAS